MSRGRAFLGAAGGSARAETPFRIGVVEDMSGVRMGDGGPNMVLATKMAVEDFGGTVLGRPIEVLSVDHQNKPDLGSGLARKLVDEDYASALVLGGASSVGLAVKGYAEVKRVTTLVTGGYAAQFSGPNCSPHGSQRVPSTGELANAVAGGKGVGESKHPLGTADLSPQILAAQGSGADVIGPRTSA